MNYKTIAASTLLVASCSATVFANQADEICKKTNLSEEAQALCKELDKSKNKHNEIQNNQEKLKDLITLREELDRLQKGSEDPTFMHQHGSSIVSALVGVTAVGLLAYVIAASLIGSAFSHGNGCTIQ